MLPIYVLTSDKYLHALRGFAYLFNKYWSPDQPVTIFGFTNPDFPLPDNIKFRSLGKFEDYPADRWSNALIRMMDLIPDELFTLMLEDYWLYQPVRLDVVGSLYDYASRHYDVVRMDLTADRLYAGGMRDWTKYQEVHIIKSDPFEQYHMSLQTAIWRKSLLQRVIIPNESPWQVELIGNTRLASLSDRMLVLGSREAPVRYDIVCQKGNPHEYLFDRLSEEDKRELADRGFLTI